MTASVSKFTINLFCKKTKKKEVCSHYIIRAISFTETYMPSPWADFGVMIHFRYILNFY